LNKTAGTVRNLVLFYRFFRFHEILNLEIPR